MIGQPRVLSITDIQRGIQALSAKWLGDASLWTEIVAANNLTPPYLTLNLSAVHGPSAADITTTAELLAGADTIFAPNRVRSINKVYLSYAGTSGIIGESSDIESYDGTTITLATPLQNAYPQGTRLQLFASYLTQNHVLVPGDTIFVPLPSAIASLNINSQQQLTDVFGSDIADPISFTNGDLTTVNGVNTLMQRIRIVIQTTIGSLPLHPEWGSGFQFAIGTPAQSIKWSALLTTCLLQLPEITGVSNVNINTQGTTAYVSVTVQVATSDAPLQLINEAFQIAA